MAVSLLEAALNQSNAVNEVLREITRAVHSSENLDRLFETIHQILSRVIDVTNFYIGLYEKTTNSISFPFFRDEYDDSAEVWDVSYLKTDSLTNEVFKELKPILLKKQDLDIRAKQKRILGTVPIIWLGIPLMTKTEPIGVMVVQSYSDPDAFTQKDVDFLCAVSEQIALAVERKQAEEALKKSESKFRALFDTMPNGFYTSSPEGYIIDANPAFIKMLGYNDLDELKSVHIPTHLYVHEEERNDMIRQHQNEEFIDGLETYRLKRKDGRIIWVEDNARYIKKEDGTVLYNQGILRDITRRKEAEDALHESEARFRTVIDHSYDAVLIHESDGRLIDVNKTMLRMFDVSYTEALSYTIDDYTGPANNIADSQNNWMRALAGEDVLFPWQARRPKDGSVFDVEVYLTRIIAGKKKLILFNVRDVTEQKKAEKALRDSEEKYRLLFENSIEGIYQTTPDGRFLSVNPSFLRIFGFNSQDELFDRFKNVGTQQYVNPEDRERLKSFIDAQGFVNSFETQLLKEDGTPIWVSMSARAVRDDSGILMYYEGFLQDITERKKAQEELYRISIHDHLTGICNRRYIFERLNAMVNEYQRETRHFSLSIVDLDFFKKINDTHGHQAGDFILKEFAAVLSDCFRPYDLVGRYGGEEFVVVAMNIDIRQTRTMLERLREIVKDCVFNFNGNLIRLTFSAGVANSGEAGLEMTVENLIRRADERLYLAKAQGRDRIITR